MRVYILTEGNRNIGFGHVTRCLALYQAFEKIGINPKLLVSGDDSIVELLKNTEYEISDWLKDRQLVFEKIKDSDIVVIDSYMADKNFYDDLSKLVKLSVYVDDNKRINYPKGIVVNGNIHAKDLNYPEREGVVYLLGTEYILLRKEFWEVPEREIRDTIRSVMITFGGSDVRNMTPKVLGLLNEIYPDLRKNVIIGKGFCNIDEIKSVADNNTCLIYYPDAEKMKRIMLDSDIAISAGGQTLYELARVGVPTIAIAVADNQLENVKRWQQTGFIEYAGCWKDKNILVNIEFYCDKLIRSFVRKNKYFLGRKLVDGKGVDRILDVILNEIERVLYGREI